MAETLGVIGLGYVGLPLAVQAAERGYEVTGIDLDEGLVATVNARESPYINDERFDAALKNTGATALRATTQYDGLRDVENVVICVPTPTENNVPDISYVTRAASQVGDQLRAGHFVSLESTVNPGVTRDEVLPILEERSGLRVGRDFFLAHCPERIDPGNKQYYVGNLNRVVGGITPACTERAVDFYESVIDGEVTPLGSAEEADPHVRANGDTIKGALVMPTVEEALEHADALFVGTAHDEYVRDLSPEMLVQFGIRYVLDGRNCLDRDGILANGIQYRGIGK